MSFLTKTVESVEDPQLKAKLASTLTEIEPVMRTLPASLVHHRYEGGLHDFVSKVLFHSLGIYDHISNAKGLGFSRDELVVMAIFSNLDPILTIRKAARGFLVDASGKAVPDFERTDDWFRDPATLVVLLMTKYDVVKYLDLHALTFKNGGWSEFRGNRSMMDISPLASVLHSATLLSMNISLNAPKPPEEEIL